MRAADRRSAHPLSGCAKQSLQTPGAKTRRGNEMGCLKSETGMTNRAVGIACPGRGAARNEVERCTADPGPDWNGPRKSGLPDLRVFERRSRVNPRSVSAAHHSAMLHAALRPGHESAATRCEPTFTCGRIRSIVSGLLFTMKTATRTCEPSARDIVLARDLHAIFELDDVRARNLLVEVCSNAWAPPHGPSACTRRKLMLVPARQIGHMSRFGAAARGLRRGRRPE